MVVIPLVKSCTAKATEFAAVSKDPVILVSTVGNCFDTASAAVAKGVTAASSLSSTVCNRLTSSTAPAIPLAREVAAVFIFSSTP